MRHIKYQQKDSTSKNKNALIGSEAGHLTRICLLFPRKFADKAVWYFFNFTIFLYTFKLISGQFRHLHTDSLSQLIF